MILALGLALANNPTGIPDGPPNPNAWWIMLGIGIVIWVLIKLESGDKND